MNGNKATICAGLSALAGGGACLAGFHWLVPGAADCSAWRLSVALVLVAGWAAGLVAGVILLSGGRRLGVRADSGSIHPAPGAVFRGVVGDVKSREGNKA